MSKRTWILGATASAVAVLGALVIVGAVASSDDQRYIESQDNSGTVIPRSESPWEPRPDDGSDVPDALGTPSSGRRAVSAPIDSAELVTAATRGSYELHLTVGLPSGCAAQGGYDVTRDGNKVEVHVYNTMPYPNNMFCTMIYGSYQLTIPITNLPIGQEVHLNVNLQKHFIFTP